MYHLWPTILFYLFLLYTPWKSIKSDEVHAKALKSALIPIFHFVFPLVFFFLYKHYIFMGEYQVEMSFLIGIWGKGACYDEMMKVFVIIKMVIDFW